MMRRLETRHGNFATMNRKLHRAVAPAVVWAALLAGGAVTAQAQPAPAPAPAAAPAPEPGPAPAAEPVPAPPPPEPVAAADEDGAEDAAPASGKKGKKVQIGGRVHAGYRMTHETTPVPATGGSGAVQAPNGEWYDLQGETKNEFVVRRARVKLRWQPDRWLLAVIQIDVAEALEVGGSILRDAYLHLSPLDQLQIRVGQFKKPFSGLALQSPAKLRIIDRGPGVEYVVEDLLYGDRDLGVQLSGRLVKKIKLDYEIGVFNGSGPVLGEDGNSKDVVGRLSARPLDWLEVGANASAKALTDPNPYQPDWVIAAGGDLRVQLGGFRLYVEGLVAPDYKEYQVNTGVTPATTPNAMAILAIASYRHRFPTAVRLAVEPAFKAELFDPDSEFADDSVWVFTPGINVYLGKYFRVMLNGEFVRAGMAAMTYLTRPSLHPDSERLEVLACFDI